MASRLDFMSKNNTSTLFTAQAMNTDEKLMKVAIVGDLDTFVGDKRANARHTVFVVGFKYLNGRLYVSEFKETSEQDMFGTATAGK